MATQSDSLPAYLVPIFPVFFVTLWVLVSQVISVLSGWHSLARRFMSQSEPYGQIRTAGPLFYVVHSRYGSHYSSVIKMTAAEDALYLSVLFLFRIGHPPLRIPWSEIQLRTTRAFGGNSVVLTLGSEERIPMRISKRMAKNLGILERIPEMQTPC